MVNFKERKMLVYLVVDLVATAIAVICYGLVILMA